MITHFLNQCKVRKRRGCFFSGPLLGLTHPGPSYFSLTSGTLRLGSNLQYNSASNFDSEPIPKVIFFFGIIADYSFHGNWNTQFGMLKSYKFFLKGGWNPFNVSPRLLHFCLGRFFCYKKSWFLRLSRVLKVSDNRVMWKYFFSIACEFSRLTKFTQDLQNILKKESWLLESAHGNIKQKLIFQGTVPIILQNCDSMKSCFPFFQLALEKFYWISETLPYLALKLIDYSWKYLLHQGSSRCFESAEWGGYQIEMFSVNSDISALLSVYFMSSNYGKSKNLRLQFTPFYSIGCRK